ncbi:MAG: phospholipid carrier-dependent glycosyltransferase [Acidimicrobiia bacterium]|nr:phospholipid carrier-dependent glycosyltransferase [Acidimicrobiia bacterium]
MSLRSGACAAAVACLFLIAFGAADLRIGQGNLDPVGGISAQDEAVYSHAALRMAEQGGWLTPVFLGRYFLYKPPLVYWLSGLSVKLLGASAFSLRLPSILAGTAVCLLLYLWTARQAGLWRAVLAAALAASSPLFLSLMRRNLTDSLLCLTFSAAVFLLWRDASAGKRSTAIILAIALAGGILTKGVAGLTAFGVAGILMLIAETPARKRIALAMAGGLALALPWFLYQMAAHPRWFWAEFVEVELLAWGASAPPQTSEESQAWFYLKRLFLTDPWLAVLSLAGAPALVMRLREANRDSYPLALWIVTAAASPLVFQYRNATYLLPLIPALALAAAIHAPLPRGPRAWLNGLAALALVSGKFMLPGAPWGLNQGATDPPPAFALAERYCAMNRGNELIIVSLAEDFYSTVLPLPRVRYALEGTGQPPAGFALDFRSMGIVVSSFEFRQLDTHRPSFAARLRQWGLDSEDALATVIALPNPPADLATLVRQSAHADFLVPARFAALTADAPHWRVVDGHGNLLLLGTTAGANPHHRACRM